MKIGLFGINDGTCGDPLLAVAVAQAAEAASFESVWTGELIVLPNPMLASFPLAAETAMLDTIVALTWIAAGCPQVRARSLCANLGFLSPELGADQLQRHRSRDLRRLRAHGWKSTASPFCTARWARLGG
jgi:alkanesulfonate monooxygenase SsuD/methylene tetrahydromethanopterin reductase-like flavin-dependent oxidoreductase (luciferase family)